MDIDIQSIKDWVAIAKDVVTGLAAITAAIVAWKGLAAWKSQLRGKTEYELAKRLMRATYKLKEAIATVRNPIQMPGEISRAIEEAKIEKYSDSDPEIHERLQRTIYFIRWQAIQDAFQDLESISLEAEALWGKDTRANIKTLRNCVSKLYGNIELYLHNIKTPQRNYDPVKEMENMKIIYAFPYEVEGNTFTEEIWQAVEKMEIFLQPRLKIHI